MVVELRPEPGYSKPSLPWSRALRGVDNCREKIESADSARYVESIIMSLARPASQVTVSASRFARSSCLPQLHVSFLSCLSSVIRKQPPSSSGGSVLDDIPSRVSTSSSTLSQERARKRTSRVVRHQLLRPQIFSHFTNLPSPLRISITQDGPSRHLYR